MLVQAAQDIPVATEIGEWASGFIVIALGAFLTQSGRARKRQTNGTSGGTKFGIGIALLVLGALMVLAQIVQLGSDPGSSDDAGQRAEAARTFALSNSFTLTGTLGDTKFNTSYVGEDAKGKTTQGDRVLEFVRSGKDFYLRGNQAYWKSFLGQVDDAGLKYLDGRWLLIDPQDTDFAPLLKSGDRAALVDSAIPAGGSWRTGDSKNIGGEKSVALKGSASGTVFVSPRDSRPLRFVDSRGNIANLSYEVVKPSAPSKFTKSTEVFE